jgi:hypothetical protein
VALFSVDPDISGEVAGYLAQLGPEPAAVCVALVCWMCGRRC